MGIDAILKSMVRDPRGVRFKDLCKVCEHYLGKPRRKGTSHHVYKTPWPGDPRVNIQNKGRMAKPYQVRQVLAAIDKLDRGDTHEA